MPATLQHLESLIGHRKMLLMLDNFEQVIDAADDIADATQGLRPPESAGDQP